MLLLSITIFIFLQIKMEVNDDKMRKKDKLKKDILNMYEKDKLENYILNMFDSDAVKIKDVQKGATMESLVCHK